MLNAILPSEERYCFHSYGEDLEYENKTQDELTYQNHRKMILYEFCSNTK